MTQKSDKLQKQKPKKLGLALGAGGARGVAHVGVLKILEQEGIPVHCIAGSSMGAVVGGLYCGGVSVADLEKRVESLRLRDIFDLELLFYRRSGLIRGKKADKILRTYLGDMDMKDCKIPFGCVAVDIASGQLKAFTEGSLNQAILASCAIPSIFTPVKIDGRGYMDGGVLCSVPADLCRLLGADVVVGVDVLFRREDTVLNPPSNIIGTLIRTIDIMERRITALTTNADLLLEIDQEVDAFAVKNLDLSFDAGLKATKAALPDIKKLLKTKPKTKSKTESESES